MVKQEGRDEKRRQRLSLLGFDSNRRSNDDMTDDSRTQHAKNGSLRPSPPPSLPPSSETSISQQRAEKVDYRPSRFRIRNPFLIGGEIKTRVSNFARMPSRSSTTTGSSDLESGGILRDKQRSETDGGTSQQIGHILRNPSQMSIPGAFRMLANGMVDDDPTVYSQNTKETNPFLIDHASLVDNPYGHAHLASGGAVPVDHPYTHGATGGPTPDFGGYPMPNYSAKRSSATAAKPRPSSSSPVGIGVPVSSRNADGLRLNRRKIRLLFLMLAIGVVALVTGIATAIDHRSKQEIPVHSADSTSSNMKPLNWNDDDLSLGDSGDTPDGGTNEDKTPSPTPVIIGLVGDSSAAPTGRPTSVPTGKTPSPTPMIKDLVGDSSAAPTGRPTFVPTAQASRIPSQLPSTTFPTILPTTPKSSQDPSTGPSNSSPSNSPSAPFPSQSPTTNASVIPTAVSSALPSVTVSTDTPTTPFLP